MAVYKVEIKEVTQENKYGDTIYEQTLNDLNVSEIVVYLNQQTTPGVNKNVKK